MPHDTLDDLFIENVFGSYFTIQKNKTIQPFTFDYILLGNNHMGRSVLGSSKMIIDDYYDYENCYIIKHVNNEDPKVLAKKLYKSIYPTLLLDEKHHQTILNLILVTSLDDSAIQKIVNFHQTKLLKLGLGGHIEVNLIGIDLSQKIVCGNKATKILQEKLKGGFNYE